MSLLDLGNHFISAGRQVYFLSTPAGRLNMTSPLDLDPSWMFVRDNGPGPLYQGYLHLLDTTVRYQTVPDLSDLNLNVTTMFKVNILK